MTADPIVRRVHEQFVAAEESAWNHLPDRERDLARYTWERWYRPGVQTIARLLARAARVSTADELVGELGGTGQLAHRFTEAAVTAGVLEIGSDGSLQWRLPEPFRYRPVDLEPPPPYGELGQLPCDQSGRHRIGELVLADLPWGGAVLLLGDDDLVAPGLAASGLYTTVLDLDGRLGPLLAGTGVGFRHGDVNLRGPVLGAIANRLITDLQRATVLSVMSFTGSLVGVVVNLVLGAITDRSRPAAAVAAGGMLFVLGLAWLPVAARHIDQDAIRQVEGEECSSEPSPQPSSR